MHYKISSQSHSHFLLLSRHISSPPLSLALFGDGCPPHSAVLEIKGMSMFIWHTESQSWLNSLTMRQTYCTVARETKLTSGVVHQEFPRRYWVCVPVRKRTKYAALQRRGWPFVWKYEVRDENVWLLADKSQDKKISVQFAILIIVVILLVLYHQHTSCGRNLLFLRYLKTHYHSPLLKYKLFKGCTTQPSLTLLFIFYFSSSLFNML